MGCPSPEEESALEPFFKGLLSRVFPFRLATPSGLAGSGSESCNVKFSSSVVDSFLSGEDVIARFFSRYTSILKYIHVYL